MGILSSIGSAISSGFSAVCSGVASVASSIGSAVSHFATHVAPKLMTIIGGVAGKLNTVVQVIRAVAVIWDVLAKDEKVEEVGDRAIQASEDGITMDQFNDFESYMDAIRNFDLDEDKSAKTDTVTKQLTGMAVVNAGLAEKLSIDTNDLGNLWLLPASNEQFFTAERIASLLEKTSDIGDVIKYFENDLTPMETLAVEKEIVASEKSLEPTKQDADIYRDLADIQQSLAKVAEKIES
ncbi:hypothetical protein [Moritella viscosa]|uniref:Uncharacterized protein n=1 Tax=Moritella viscosa TaxID=80854 RepID=A0A1L0F7M7_9GAMM|nr:hypothetical protein [Moritella viscosa]SGZ18620.1 Putative uncharacterized protein [Moritella viscosa]SHO14482.1 Putative uncharacterized protein [Moritella viscosa]SHO15361.1 Putative uncharacterized protein [Moritella viscosa]SHO18055.1 Putative uncharacterized protein [Moritella viscosa]SHO18970.1 Putative uncharacterized protein [Moritella viscosa]